jgi:hypothetical protein
MKVNFTPVMLYCPQLAHFNLLCPSLPFGQDLVGCAVQVNRPHYDSPVVTGRRPVAVIDLLLADGELRRLALGEVSSIVRMMLPESSAILTTWGVKLISFIFSSCFGAFSPYSFRWWRKGWHD